VGVVTGPRIWAVAGAPPASTKAPARTSARTGGSLPGATSVSGCTSSGSPCAR
jgi:hypothetical protein